VRRGGARTAAVFFAGVPLAAVLACRAPTQITVSITTDVPCDRFGGSTLTVGVLGAIETQPATSSKATCSGNGRIGTVVIAPSGAKDDLVAMKLVMGIGHSAETCTLSNGYQGGCIVARRALRFLPHEDLHVVVGLDAQCTDYPCGANETCVDHTCKAAIIDDSSKCTRTQGCGDEALGDGGAGDGSTGSDGGPLADSGGPSATSLIAAGSNHTCALTTGGGVKCWGQNVVNQLGNNTIASSEAPRDVMVDTSTLLTRVLSIHSGRDTTCALVDSGDPRCWGIALDTPDNDGGSKATYPSARPWPTLRGASEIAFGKAHLCWRIGSASAECMGLNEVGQLGTGDVKYGLPPVTPKVTGPFAELAAGLAFTCFLSASGVLSCTGDNGANQSDPGGPPTFSTPKAIASIPPVAEVTAGAEHVCARITSDGSVQCWGDTSFGQSGTNPDAGNNIPPTTVHRIGGAPLVGTKRMASGDYHTCVITKDDKVACWGVREHANLGRNTPPLSGGSSFEADDVVGVSDVIDLAAGLDHTCAVTRSREVYCWGLNGDGECGQPMGVTNVIAATKVF
jgi:hypothetical protein